MIFNRVWDCKTKASRSSQKTYILNPLFSVLTLRTNMPNFQASPSTELSSKSMMSATRFTLNSFRGASAVWMFLIALLSANLWAQNDTLPEPLWPDGEAGIDFNTIDQRGKKQGDWIRVWPDGSMYYQGTFKDGYPTGQFVYFHDQGGVMSTMINMDQGRRVYSKTYRTDGSLQAEGMYMRRLQLNSKGDPMHEKHGAWKFYDEAGNLRLQENYDRDVKHGAYGAYSSKGQTLEEGNFVKGDRDGTWRTFDEAGTLLSEMSYRIGLFHGACRIFYEQGLPQSAGMYIDGVEHGFWKTFHSNGTVETTRQFDHGTLISEVFENGTFESTFIDGRPRSVYTFIKGLKHGTFQEWHDAGEWVIVEEQEESTGEIIARQILAGQQLRLEGEYINGQLDGELFHFDLNGRVARIDHYEVGNLIRSEER